MLKLLRANFRLLIRFKLFYIAFLLNTALSILVSHMYGVMNQDIARAVFVIFEPMMCSAFIALFIGREHSSGTLRNKIAYGHTKTKVYLSYLITCIPAVLVIIVPGLIIFGVSQKDFFSVYNTGLPILMFFGFVFAEIAICSLCVAVAFNVSVRAVSVVICVFMVLVGYFTASMIEDMLRERPTTYEYVYGKGDYEIIDAIEVPNPHYIEGTNRIILCEVLDFIPHGQINQYYIGLDSAYRCWYEFTVLIQRPERQVDYDLYTVQACYFKDNEVVKRDFEYMFFLNQFILIGVSTLIGLALFKKKNLK